MPSRADVDELVNVGRSVRALIERDLTAFWNSLDLGNPESARNALLAFMPILVAQYGDITGTVAADWYTRMRGQANAPGRFKPTVAANLADEFIETGTRWAVGPLWSEDQTNALDRLIDSAQRWSAQTGRNTIIQSASRDAWKPRVARVPTGAETCSFCLVLASRGAVYTSLETAGRWNKYHGKCDCQAVVIGPHDSYPEGYDPDALYNQYLDARAQAGTTSLSGSGSEDDHDLSILQVMRRSGDPDVLDAVH